MPICRVSTRFLPKISILSVLWLALFGICEPRRALAEVAEQGLSWLRAAQRLDGAWAGDQRLTVRDSAEAVRALSSASQSDAGAAYGLSRLSALGPSNVDVEARRLIALREAIPDFLLADAMTALLLSRNADGGWGFDGTFSESTALETALALRALARSAQFSPSVALSGLARLSVLQNIDGGFGHGIDRVSEIAITSEVLLALNELAALTNVELIRAPLTSFLKSTINADGGFPPVAGAPSDVTSTALALSALLTSGGDVQSLLAGRDYLRFAQSSNGSWLDDPYTTALALQVVGSERPDLAVASATALPLSVEQGSPATLTVNIANRGLANSPATALNVYTSDPALGGPPLATRAIAALVPGQTVSEAFVIDTAPLLGSATLYCVIDPAGTIGELSEVNNRKVAILIVRAPGSSIPTPGNQAPIITSFAPRTAVLNELYTYQVTATDPEGGPLEFGLVEDGRIPPVMTMSPQGLLMWTPFDRTGLRMPNIYVRDSEGAMSVQNLAIEVIEFGEKRAPLFDSSPLSAARPGALYAYRAVVEDPDGGNVNVALLQGPTGMSFNPVTQALAWTPTASDIGEHIIRLAATDDEAQATEQAWVVTVSTVTRDAVDIVVLAVEASGVSSHPQTLKPTGTVTVTLGNQGPSPAKNVTVALAEDRDGDFAYSTADGPLVGTQVLSQLGPGETATVSIAATGVLLFRDNRLWAVADPQKAITETREDNNTLAAGEQARKLATQGAFEPKLKWSWQEDTDDPSKVHSVIHAPLVAQVNDDNGDGHAGDGDVPDVVFIAFSGLNAVPNRLRALDGRNGQLILDVESPGVNSLAPAIGDLDGDGFPEIVVVGTDLMVYAHDGDLIWSVPLIRVPNTGGPVIADLDGDGKGEVIVQDVVYEHDGTLRCRGRVPGLGSTLVADLDLDGKPEIIAGYSVLRANCAPMWEANAEAYASMVVGQFDHDPELEVLEVGNPTRLYEHDGTFIRSLYGLPFWPSSATVADFDGDGESEIAVLTPGGLSVVEPDGVIRWTQNVLDGTGLSTVATAADLDGDGRAEAVFQGSDDVYIFSGQDGRILWQDRAQDGTVSDFVTIADVDADGRLDLVSPGNILPNVRFSPGIGIRVFSDLRWSTGRTLFSNFNFHQTDLRCDQRPPAQEPRFWQLTSNGIRASGDLPRAAREALGCEKGLADLTVSLLRADRAACTSSIDFIVRVGNGGMRTVPPQVPVVFSAAFSGGPLTPVGNAATTRSLPPGGYEDVRVTVAPPPPGPISVLAQVDPDGKVADQNPTNNVHTFTMPSCEGGNQPPVFTSVPVLTAQVGKPFSYIATAEDPDADQVTLTMTTGPSGLTFSPSGLAVWVPVAAQVGPHLVSLRASDSRGGATVQEFVVVVTLPDLTLPPILPELPNFAMTIATDAPTYAAASVATITTTLTNQEAYGRAGKLTVVVLDNDGSEIARLINDQDVLFTGAASQSLNVPFEVRFTPPGSYVAEARYVETNGQYVQRTTFSIAPSSGLVASVQPNRVSYGPRDRAIITSLLRNTGLNEPLLGLTTVLEVLDPAQAVVFSTSTASRSLAAGGTDERLAEFPINGRSDGTYVARLTVSRPSQAPTVVEKAFLVASAPHLAGDINATPNPVARGELLFISGTLTNSGNAPLIGDAHIQFVNPRMPSTLAETIVAVNIAVGASATISAPFDTSAVIAGVYLAVIDVTPSGQAAPIVLNLSKPFSVVSGGAPVVTVSVPTCTNTNVTPVITVSGAGIVSQTRTLDGAPYNGAPVSAEGTHTLVATATNGEGATGSATATFVIDRTSPVVVVSGISNGVAYPTDVSPGYAVTDPNLVSSSASLDASSYLSGTPVSSEGTHVLAVVGQDCAGNQATVETTFIIDKTAPDVSIGGVVACGKLAVSPVVTINELHPQSQTQTLDGLPWDGAPVTSEGVHSLVVNVTDVAGNTTTRSANFIIDQTAPQVSLSGVVNGASYASSVTPVFAINDANLVASSSLLNGIAFTSGTVVSADGSQLLELSGSDCAGNTTQVQAAFLIDKAPPVIAIDGVPACGQAAVTPVVRIIEPNITSQSFVLDGAPWLGTPIISEGQHLLVVSVTDATGSTTTQSETFVIDRTPPQLLLSGVTNGGTYMTPVVPVFSATDLNLVSSSATLDGAAFASGTAVASNGNHVLDITAFDCAGNTANSSTAFLIDNSAPVITISQVPACGQANVSPVITINAEHLQSQSILVDGVAWNGAPIASEGSHVLSVSATTTAGATATASATFIIDRTAPTVTLSGIANGGSYANDVTPVFLVTDAHLTASSALLDGAAFISGSAVSQNGDHHLQLNGQDCAGNTVDVAAMFTIDKVAPVIAIANVMACGPAAVSPVVTVTEANLLSQSFLLDGAAWAGTPVSSEGAHVLVVSATDRAGNVSTASAAFVIDRTAPQITLSGVANGGNYAGSVSPVFGATDPNLVLSSATLDGSPFSSGMVVSLEGDHALAISAEDCAGNSANATAQFTIDRTAPTISIGAPACTAQPVTPAVTVSDAHLASQSTTLDGQPWNGAAIATDGNHVVVVTAVDTAGNTATASKTFIVDTIAPSLSVSGVTNGGAYPGPVTPIFSASDAHLVTSSATLDGSSFASGTVVSGAGNHTLAVTAQDCAGNTASDSRAFLIDTTAPVVTISVLSCSQGPVTPVVQVTEANVLTDVRTLDGVAWTGAPISTQGNHTLNVVVTDTAGNQGTASKSFIVDATAPTVTITGVVEGATYSSAVSPTVTFADANLTSSSLVLDGATFVSGSSVSAPGAHTLTATATDCAGLSTQRVVHFTISNSTNPKVLLVVNATPLTTADAALKARLEAPLNYQVQVATGVNVQAADTAGKVAVVISESTESAAVGSRLNGVAVPMVVMEPSLFDDFAMTGPTWMTDFGDIFNVTTINVHDRIHPLNGGTLGTTSISSVPTKLEWGNPAASARRIASISTPIDSRAAIFSYKRGNALVGGALAPARRVGFFAGRDNPAFFTPAAWQLFDAAVKWAVSKKPEALLLVGAIPLTSADQKVRARLQSKGFEVLVQTPTFAAETDARGTDLIVIGESVLSTTIGPMFKNTAVPVVLFEPSLFDDMGLTGPTWMTDYGDNTSASQISITTPSHPLAGGLGGTRTVSSPPGKLIWGKPNSNAAKVATMVGQSQQSTIFGYTAGASMVVGTAPARRVGWFAGRDLPDTLTTDGWTLFDAAVSWASPGSAQ